MIRAARRFARPSHAGWVAASAIPGRDCTFQVCPEMELSLAPLRSESLIANYRFPLIPWTHCMTCWRPCQPLAADMVRSWRKLWERWAFPTSTFLVGIVLSPVASKDLSSLSSAHLSVLVKQIMTSCCCLIVCTGDSFYTPSSQRRH